MIKKETMQSNMMIQQKFIQDMLKMQLFIRSKQTTLESSTIALTVMMDFWSMTMWSVHLKKNLEWDRQMKLL